MIARPRSSPTPRLPAFNARRAPAHTTAQVSNDDTVWLITLSDLTLLLVCFLGLWYVKHEQKYAKQQTARPALHVAQESRFSAPPPLAIAHALDWSKLRNEIEDFIAESGLKEDVRIEAASDEILISFKDTVPFASGKAEIKPEALPILEKVAAIAVARPAMQLEVNGHTDDRPISTSEFPSNWELSSARASRVARYLIEKGVHPSRIGVQGFAYNRPRVPNENSTSRRTNRRVEIRIMRSSDGAATQLPNPPNH
jgi:chemotaxis protein MotB